MFVKPYKGKPQTSLKNSDKKKLRARLNASGGGQDLDADDLGLSNEKSAVLSIQKVHTNDGEQMTVYWEDADPILIENRGGTLFPSVYLIWRQPRLLTSNRVFFIHSGVLERLQGGADLMAPGVILCKNNDVERLQKNNMVGFRTLSSEGASAIIAIGRVIMTNAEIKERSRGLTQGRFAQIITVLGDTLWQAGSQWLPSQSHITKCNGYHMPVPDPEEITGTAETEEKDDSHEQSDTVHNPENTTTPSDLESTSPEAQEAKSPEQIEAENIAAQLIQQTETMDKLLECGMFTALKTTFRERDPPALPLLCSQFYTKYVYPNIPKRESDPKFEIKKTSYKNLNDFLKQLEEHGVLTLKLETEKNHLFIASVDPKHKFVRQFKLTDDSLADDLENLHLPVQPGEAKLSPKIETFYGVTSNAVAILAGTRRGNLLTGKEVRELLIEYMEKNQLLLSGGECTPDPALASASGVGDLTAKIQKVNEGFTKKMTLTYKVVYCNRERVVKTSSKIPQVVIKVVKRGGNKKVTYVLGLEQYFISVESVAQGIKKKLQASTVINSMTPEEASSMFGTSMSGKKDTVYKNIQIQGGQTPVIKKYLFEEFKLTDKFITVNDNSAPKKKQNQGGGKSNKKK